jgi:hypothetical protein
MHKINQQKAYLSAVLNRGQRNKMFRFAFVKCNDRLSGGSGSDVNHDDGADTKLGLRSCRMSGIAVDLLYGAGRINAGLVSHDIIVREAPVSPSCDHAVAWNLPSLSV